MHPVVAVVSRSRSLSAPVKHGHIARMRSRVLVSIVAILVGCGSGASAPLASEPSPPPDAAPAATPAAATQVVAPTASAASSDTGKPSQTPPGGERKDALATAEECKQVYEVLLHWEFEGHTPEVVKMVRESMGSAQEREAFVNQCVGSTLRSEAACYLNAKTRAAYERCKWK